MTSSPSRLLMHPIMRITMKEVARQAKVSISTVSLVINETGGISEATREHVKSIIRELKYTPDAQARRLSSGQTGIVALVMPPWRAAFTDPYFIELMRGTLEAVRDRGFQMLLETCDERFQEHRLWNDLFAAKKVDGLLVATPYLDQDYLRELDERGLPALLINGERPDLPGLDFVGYDDVACGEEATNHLLRLGHRRVVHIAGDMKHASAVHRLEGYRAALEKSGLPFRPEDVLAGDYMPLEARQALETMLERPRERWPSAIFCANDTMALSVITHLRELGFSVPRDFSVLGVDDTGPAGQSVPALTTFRQDIFWLAQMATALFFDKLEGKTGPEPIRIRPAMRFVERESCARFIPVA